MNNKIKMKKKKKKLLSVFSFKSGIPSPHRGRPNYTLM
jgi:hypothetical protein